MDEIGGEGSYTWLGLGMSLAFAAVALSCGSLSDLMGRRYLGVFGAGLVVAGMAIVGTAHNMPVAIGGMAVTGAGAGISQVIGISAILELVPVKQRGRYLGTVFLLYSPMAAAPAYGKHFATKLIVAQLWSSNLSWRWGAWLSIGLAVVAFFLVLTCYHPKVEPRLGEIDYLGNLLSISGIALFMLGLQWGGYN